MSSDNNIYKPTWLYIKQHNQTGLKYFGKTTKTDPYRYKGSGSYWLSHLKKHGSDITTVWCQRFESKDELIKYAIAFSEKHNIVESSDWANLMDENGLTGFPVGMRRTEEHRRKLSESLKGRTPNRSEQDKANAAQKASEKLKGRKKPAGFGDKIRAARTGIPISETAKKKMSNAWNDDRRRAQAERTRIKNSSRPTIECPHCHKVGQLKLAYHLKTCPVLHPKEITRVQSTSRATGWVLMSPDGMECSVNSLRKFCREHNLNSPAMVEVSLGNRDHHKGWKVIARLTGGDKSV